ncbi:WD40 repeat-like protein [Hyphopichia burtonii NRRL Y-1933]|uniref:WD40 repeat-like protein n=1 Tax=Hyphopichia burtonii NRRL Y-1933 TaxID=984485 RepID=A0A1E4RPV3_9ASCO|nr:WD40 repeat-like protein [Hyphopichia burtonii NRRL Y-1933]ODV69297.1 WD40 repeat-like protein [Hyphopichia burtonii NRRL Y-1933]
MELNEIPIVNDPKQGYGLINNGVQLSDDDVKVELTKRNQPTTLLNETKDERRTRLQKIIDESRQDQIVSSDQDMEDDEGDDEDDEEEFYTPGSDELYQARLKILSYSLERADKRLQAQKERSKKQDFTQILKARRSINADLSQIELYGTQLIPGNTRALSATRFNNNGTLIGCGSWDGNVYFLNSTDLKLEKSLLSGFHTEKVSGIDWKPIGDENILVSGGNEGCINFWNIDTEKDKLSPTNSIKQAHSNRITKTLYHPSGDYIASTSFDQTWKLWDPRRPESELVEQEGHSKELFAASFHPDGSLLATGGLDAIGRIWDLRSGRSIALLQSHIKGIYSMDWSNNGYHLATASGDCSVKIWDLRKLSSKELFSIPAHNKLVSEVRFYHQKEASRDLDRDSSYLITSSYDNTINIWSADNWVKQKSLQGHNDKIMSCDISPNGDSIVSCGWDRSVKLWSGP